MPVTLLGFSLQGLSPSQSLRYLSIPAALSTLAPPKRLQELKPRPQGLSLCEDPTPPTRRESLPKAAALLVFSPLGFSPPPCSVAFATAPLMSFPTAAAKP
jgi:hypothetical protein